MSKLLRANMARLWKSKVFRLSFIAFTAMGAFQRLGMGMDTETHYLDEAFWIDALLIGIVLAVFISLFVGTEFEDGTVRNKIVSGHMRWEVYFANVAVCILAGWLMCLGHLISSLLVGIPLLGFFHKEISTVVLEGICVFALSAAYTAIYCFIAMSNSNRTVTAVVCVLLSVLLLYAGGALLDQLEEPEYYYAMNGPLGMGETDDGQDGEWVRNPDYVEGTERRVIETIYDILPGGQSLQLCGMLDSGRFAVMFLASLGWVVLSSGCGAVIFRKRDLK